MYYNDYLAHYGTPRMRWGVRHGPPYPIDKDSSGRPKITTVIKSKLKKKAEERKEKQHEVDKKDVISDPRKLYKNRDKFSDEELKQIIDRINLDTKIKEITDNAHERFIKNYERAQKFLSTSEAAGQNLLNIYDLAAKVQNAFVDAGKLNGEKWVRVAGSQSSKKGDNQQNNQNSGNVDVNNQVNSNNTTSTGGSSKKKKK